MLIAEASSNETTILLRSFPRKQSLHSPVPSLELLSALPFPDRLVGLHLRAIFLLMGEIANQALDADRIRLAAKHHVLALASNKAEYGHTTPATNGLVAISTSHINRRDPCTCSHGLTRKEHVAGKRKSRRQISPYRKESTWHSQVLMTSLPRSTEGTRRDSEEFGKIELHKYHILLIPPPISTRGIGSTPGQLLKYLQLRP